MANRDDYERAVRALAVAGVARLGRGELPEQVARDLVGQRNALKVEHRRLDNPAIVRTIEARNRVKYGNPVGPDPDSLFRKYGSWEEVIAACGRHARFSDG